MHIIAERCGNGRATVTAVFTSALECRREATKAGYPTNGKIVTGSVANHGFVTADGSPIAVGSTIVVR